MNAHRITAEQIAYLRDFVAVPRAMSWETIRTLEDCLDSLESAYAELDRLSARLEISDDHPFDGIECRNLTIRGLEQDIASMRDQLRVARLSAQGGEVAEPDASIIRSQGFTTIWWTSNPCGERNKENLERFLRENPGAVREDLWRRPAPPHPDTVEVSREAYRWIPVEESLPEDQERVGFIVDCGLDDFLHGRVYAGSFNRRDWDARWGGFNTHGFGAYASHWCRLPPIPDALRAQAQPATDGGTA